MKRDELNILADKYYSVMDISVEQKEKRKVDAWELFDLFMLFFLWFDEAQNANVQDYSFFLPEFQEKLQDAVGEMIDIDDFVVSYIVALSLGVFTTTTAHLDDKYYLSEDRAVNLALNESNSINNYDDLRKAKEHGYTHKKWIAQLDERTRPEHIEMDYTVIPIDRFFFFFYCRMLYPHDIVHGTPAQNANCRCTLEFIKK